MLRYEHPCPACHVAIPALNIGTHSQLCPACGQELQYDCKNRFVVWPAAILGGVLLAWHLGYDGLFFVLVAELIAGLLLFFGQLLGTFLEIMVFAPGYKLAQHGRRRPFDRMVSLRLSDKPDADKKIDP